MKTIKEHLKVLPLQKRLQATENSREYRKKEFKIYLNLETEKEFTLIGAFIFRNTKQGFDYWANINRQYFDPNF